MLFLKSVHDVLCPPPPQTHTKALTPKTHTYRVGHIDFTLLINLAVNLFFVDQLSNTKLELSILKIRFSICIARNSNNIVVARVNKFFVKTYLF